MGWFDKPAPKRASKAAKPKRCQICRKAPCDCRTNKVKPIRETVKITDSRGRNRTVTRNSKTVSVDSRGIEWCSRCSCRVMNGRCTNVTCSTRN